uniref:Ashwin n=1 Tax=Globodera pallida TaxID=36090 RepID=A0A183C1U1_GLOPA
MYLNHDSYRRSEINLFVLRHLAPLKSPLKALRSAVLSKKSTASAGSGVSMEEPSSAVANHQQHHHSSPALPSSAPAQYRRKISFLGTAEETGELPEEEESRRSPAERNTAGL